MAQKSYKSEVSKKQARYTSSQQGTPAVSSYSCSAVEGQHRYVLRIEYALCTSRQHCRDTKYFVAGYGEFSYDILEVYLQKSAQEIRIREHRKIDVRTPDAQSILNNGA